MNADRRGFLKAAALVAQGLVAGRAVLAAAQALGQSDLVAPGAALKAGRWAMVIDIKKCIDTKDCGDACIRVCHATHNVPEIADKRHEIKWIWKEPGRHLFPEQSEYQQTLAQPILALCNHCDNPPCVRVCPTQATFKQPDGIVAMDEHRCIGCRFCMAACPYGSRSFNWENPRPYLKTISPDFPPRTAGVVEKCTFCSERLAVGKLPLCVEGCPAKAIVFGDVQDRNSAVRKLLETSYTLRRKPELGTGPAVYYKVS